MRRFTVALCWGEHGFYWRVSKLWQDVLEWPWCMVAPLSLWAKWLSSNDMYRIETFTRPILNTPLSVSLTYPRISSTNPWLHQWTRRRACCAPTVVRRAAGNPGFCAHQRVAPLTGAAVPAHAPEIPHVQGKTGVASDAEATYTDPLWPQHTPSWRAQTGSPPCARARHLPRRSTAPHVTGGEKDGKVDRYASKRERV